MYFYKTGSERQFGLLKSNMSAENWFLQHKLYQGLYSYSLNAVYDLTMELVYVGSQNYIDQALSIQTVSI